MTSAMLSVSVASNCFVLFLCQDEMCLSGYRKFLASQAAPLPLTAAEEELKQIKLSEVQTRGLWFIWPSCCRAATLICSLDGRKRGF